MLHTKFDSNQTDNTGEEDVLESVAKIGGRTLSLPNQGPMAMPNELNIKTCSRIPHIYLSAFGLVVSDKKIFKENTGFGVHLSPSFLEGVDPKVKHNMTRTHCLDASYQI